MQFKPSATGLYVPSDFAEAGPLFEEVAGTGDGRDITRGYVDALSLLQPTDSILLGRGGGDIKLYDEVKRDDQVASTFQQRRLAVVSREWSVEPGGTGRKDKKAAESLQDQLDNLPFDNAFDKMLWTVFYGYGVGEFMWAADGAEVRLDNVLVRNRRRFKFDGDNRLRLITSADPRGELLPDRKFWVVCTGADNDDEPYGLGLAHWLYWPVYFKRNGLKFWLILLDKFGVPTAVGKYPANATPADKTKLLAAVKAIKTDAGIIIPEGMLIELLEATRGGSVDHATFYDKMDAAISKVVLSQTMTTDNGSSLAQAEVHKDVKLEVVKADADLLCSSFNETAATWLTDWNYPGAAYPKVWRKVDDEPDLKEQADREKTVVDMGVARPTLKHIQETYGGEWEAIPEKPAPVANETEKQEAEQGAAFAEGGKRTIDALIDQLDAVAGGHVDGWLDQVRQAIEAAESMDELESKLLELYPTLATDQLATVMQQALTLAELMGRAEIGGGA